MLVELKGISKSFGNLKVTENISLSIDKGETACLVGPSGCGKSTLLRIIGGLEKPDEGSIKGNFKRSAFIFQEPRLISWLTTEKNIEIVLKGEISSKAERRSVISEVLRLVNLQGFEDYYPDQLSGGMKQRVAIARALSIKPDLLLMDEPFANIDFPLRLIFIRLLDKILSGNLGGLYITHDTREAVLICDRIYVLTSRPSKVKKIYEIKVPRLKRDLEHLKTADEITDLLMEEYKNG